MKVHLTSAYADAEPLATFRQRAELDRFGVHSVTTSADEANLILFVENSHYEDDSFFGRLRRHPLVRREREKCFMYNEHDRPFCPLPGLYSSMPAPWFDRGRQRAWAYIFTRNPYLDDVARGVVERDLLFSFAGRRNAPVRDLVLALRDREAVLQDDSHFDAYAQRINEGDTPLRFAQLIGRSRFVLCPRGIGTGTNRLQEIMQCGRVPVILADEWVAPEGPAWDRFSVRVKEADVPRIPALLRTIDHQSAQMGQLAREAWEEWFAPDVTFHRMIEACADIVRTRRVREEVSQRFPRPLPLYLQYRARAVLRPLRHQLELMRAARARQSSDPGAKPGHEGGSRAG